MFDQARDFHIQRRAGVIIGRRLDLGESIDTGMEVESDLLAQQFERRPGAVSPAFRLEQGVLRRVPLLS